MGNTTLSYFRRGWQNLRLNASICFKATSGTKYEGLSLLVDHESMMKLRATLENDLINDETRKTIKRMKTDLGHEWRQHNDAVRVSLLTNTGYLIPIIISIMADLHWEETNGWAGAVTAIAETAVSTYYHIKDGKKNYPEHAGLVISYIAICTAKAAMNPKFITNNNEQTMFGREYKAIALLALGIGAHLIGGSMSISGAWLHHREDLAYIVSKGATLQSCVDGIYQEMITKRIQSSVLTEKSLKMEEENLRLHVYILELQTQIKTGKNPPTTVNMSITEQSHGALWQEEQRRQREYKHRLNIDYLITYNSGEGDCLYYAINDALRAYSAEFRNSHQTHNASMEETRLAAVRGAVSLIRSGRIPITHDILTGGDCTVGSIDNQSIDEYHIRQDHIEQLARSAMESQAHHGDILMARQSGDTTITLNDITKYLLTNDTTLEANIEYITTRYATIHSKPGTWGGDANIAGACVGRGVDIRLIQYDTSVNADRSDYRTVTNYNYKTLSADDNLNYTLKIAPVGIGTEPPITLIHLNGNHYVAGVLKPTKYRRNSAT